MVEAIQISLAAARVNAKLTQDDVAARMKISKKTIINWEKGVAMPSFADLNMLSNIYGIPVDNIFYHRNILKVILQVYAAILPEGKDDKEVRRW